MRKNKYNISNHPSRSQGAMSVLIVDETVLKEYKFVYT